MRSFWIGLTFFVISVAVGLWIRPALVLSTPLSRHEQIVRLTQDPATIQAWNDAATKISILEDGTEEYQGPTHWIQSDSLIQALGRGVYSQKEAKVAERLSQRLTEPEVTWILFYLKSQRNSTQLHSKSEYRELMLEILKQYAYQHPTEVRAMAQRAMLALSVSGEERSLYQEPIDQLQRFMISFKP